MKKADRPAAILRGEDSQQRFIKFGINGSPTVHAVIEASDSCTKVTVVDDGKDPDRRINNPYDDAAFVAEADRIRRTNSTARSEMQVSFHKDLHVPRRARVGWLRAAYLSAAFGYRYVFCWRNSLAPMLAHRTRTRSCLGPSAHSIHRTLDRRPHELGTRAPCPPQPLSRMQPRVAAVAR